MGKDLSKDLRVTVAWSWGREGRGRGAGGGGGVVVKAFVITFHERYMWCRFHKTWQRSLFGVMRFQT